MNIFRFLYLFVITNALNNEYYPFDPRIHTLGNHGILGGFHAKLAPSFTYLIDKTVYGVDVRNTILEQCGDSKRILDFGCGTGFSTSKNDGCIGIDTSDEMIIEAKNQFPYKLFEYGHAENYKSEKIFDIVTCMFLMHEVPQIYRKKIINNALSLACEKVIIVDISPEYIPSDIMLLGEPYLLDYLQNIQNDLYLSVENIIIKGHVNMWTINK
jgi:SAM-dependent methyltransferase